MSAPVQSLIVICILILALSLMVLLRPQGAEAVVSVLRVMGDLTERLIPNVRR